MTRRPDTDTSLETAAGDPDRAALAAAVEEILTDHCADERVAATEGHLDRTLWEVLASSGLTAIGLPEERGGSGGDLGDVAAVLHACGAHSAPVPIADALLACLLLRRVSLNLPTGLVVAAAGDLTAEHEHEHGNGAGAGHLRVHGTLRRVALVPGTAATIAAVATGLDGTEHVVLLPAERCVAGPGRNLAGEPRSTVTVELVLAGDAAAPAPPGTATDLRRTGALLRAALVAGAAQGAVDRTVRHVTEREQFGRPIARFQTVQHEVARMAGEAAACRAAVDAAVEVVDSGIPSGAIAGGRTVPVENPASVGSGTAAPDASLVAVAAAKVQACRGAEQIAARAHQLHGAIGTTFEHGLRLQTTRLWAWSAEWGGEAEWADVLAQAAFHTGGAGLWPMLTS
ncbi:acyl-CoA dehydrogenase [Frankia sp. EI5c]|uniref:acyl-CoA dehydrogenase n=1 Tax=Frankia sp. EI5c TaxID=683316 RepID=UPI0007C277B2|nr:acyl-CoA dehydrogenase [Frankia sp. EI5c]OAA27442.1 acyl-CoA dehydrogenase [Frankia sp. EI5c]